MGSPARRNVVGLSGSSGALYTSVLALLAAVLLAAPGCSRAPSKPSLLLVVMEGVRADHTSLYGYVRPTSPHLDAIGMEGAVFEQAFTSSPYTPAAIGSLLTGRYPPEHGLMLGSALNPGVRTLAEILKESGYATHVVSSEPSLTRESGLLRGFEQTEIVDPAESDDLEWGAAEVSRRAIEWIDRGRDRSRPFFLALIYSSPTLPFKPPEEFRHRFTDPREITQRLEEMAEYWVPFARRFNAREIDLSSRDVGILRDLYDGEVAYADEQIGAVVGALRKAGSLDATLLVVTSDRGEDLGEQHRLADPTSLRESNLRIPLVMRYPPRIKAGLKEAVIAQDVDVIPTVCDLIGVARPSMITKQAVSHVPFDGSVRRAPAVSLAVQRAADGAFELLMSLRDPQYRFILAPQGPAALYDLKSDPESMIDILAKSQDLAASMTAKLAEWDESLKAAGGSDQTRGAAPGAVPPAGAPPAGGRP